MGGVTPEQLPAAWGLARPWRVRPVGAGMNNLSWYVETPRGEYVLRVYQNTADRRRISYEHRLLGQLAETGLPFAVPAPVPIGTDETVTIAGDGQVAALFRRVPGERPRRGNAAHARLVGRALAQLHRGLRMVEPGAPPERPTYGDLDRIHRLAPAPQEVASTLPLTDDERVALAWTMVELIDEVPALYRSLPRQIVHGDYGPGNTLVLNERITAVLDFETAGPDLRAIDVALGLYWAAGEVWDRRDGDPWPQVDAFAQGFLAEASLVPAEAAALPILCRLQRAVSLLHWVGRMREGKGSEDVVVEQARRLLRLDGWLVRNAGRLSQRFGG